MRMTNPGRAGLESQITGQMQEAGRDVRGADLFEESPMKNRVYAGRCAGRFYKKNPQLQRGDSSPAGHTGTCQCGREDVWPVSAACFDAFGKGEMSVNQNIVSSLSL